MLLCKKAGIVNKEFNDSQFHIGASHHNLPSFQGFTSLAFHGPDGESHRGMLCVQRETNGGDSMMCPWTEVFDQTINERLEAVQAGVAVQLPLLDGTVIEALEGLVNLTWKSWTEWCDENKPSKDEAMVKFHSWCIPKTLATFVATFVPHCKVTDNLLEPCRDCIKVLMDSKREEVSACFAASPCILREEHRQSGQRRVAKPRW